MTEGPLGGPRPFAESTPTVRVFYKSISDELKKNIGEIHQVASDEFITEVAVRLGEDKADEVMNSTTGDFNMSELGEVQGEYVILNIPLPPFSLEELSTVNEIVKGIGEVNNTVFQ